MHTALARKNQAPQRSRAPTSARGHPSIRNILRGPTVQPKLRIGAANDPAEREADAVADRVMRLPSPAADQGAVLPASGLGPGPDPNPIRRMCDGCEDELQRQPIEQEKDELEVQRMTAGEGPEVDEDELIQPKERPGATPALSAGSETAIRGLGGGAPLAASERAFFEPRFGRDFSGVRIHSGAAADTSAKSINARAYTLGSDIAFSSGEYTPGTPSGRHLMAHELTHTVQQGKARSGQTTVRREKPKRKSKGTKAEDSPELKLEKVKVDSRACLVSVHREEESARKIAQKMYEHCNYNFISVQGPVERFLVLPKHGTKEFDPNAMFPKNIARDCMGNIDACRDFVKTKGKSSDKGEILEYVQKQYFLAVHECSDGFALPVISLHNNALNDTKEYRKALEKKRPKLGSAAPKDDEKAKKFKKLLDSLKMEVDKRPEGDRDPGNKKLEDMKEPLRDLLAGPDKRTEKTDKATDEGILYGKSGKTNILRWCNASDLIRCHIGDPEHPDDVVWVTNPADYAKLSATKKINVVIQRPLVGGVVSPESENDLSTLFLILGQIFVEEYIGEIGTAAANIEAARAEIMKTIQELWAMNQANELTLEAIFFAAIKIYANELKIGEEDLIIIWKSLVSAMRLERLRYVNVETGEIKVDTNKDPGKFKFILSVLDPLGMNFCDDDAAKKVRSDLGV